MTYVHGTYNAICDRCGFKYKAYELRMTWNNLFVCPICYEDRHPQEDVFATPDKQLVPIPRPGSVDTGYVVQVTFQGEEVLFGGEETTW